MAPVNSWANYTGSRNVGDVQRQGDGVWFYPQDTFATNFSFPDRRRLRQHGTQYLPRTPLLRHGRIPREALPDP